jgi:hypothetical protein
MIEVENSSGFGIKSLRILHTFGSLKGNLIFFEFIAPDVLTKACLSNVKTF